jgi:hypothetical protein
LGLVEVPAGDRGPDLYRCASDTVGVGGRESLGQELVCLEWAKAWHAGEVRALAVGGNVAYRRA